MAGIKPVTVPQMFGSQEITGDMFVSQLMTIARQFPVGIENAKIAVANIYRDEFTENFYDQGFFVNNKGEGKWKRISESWRKRKARMGLHTRILDETGMLARSIKYKIGKNIKVYCDLSKFSNKDDRHRRPYPFYHNEGKGNNPKRQFIGHLPDSELKKVIGVITAKLVYALPKGIYTYTA